MSKDITIRLTTPAGKCRVVLPGTATLGDLQAEVQKRTQVDPAAQILAFDKAGAKPLRGNGASTLAQLGIANGQELNLVNKEAAIAAQVLTKVPVPAAPEEAVKRDAATTAASGAAGVSGSSGSAGTSGGPSSSNAATSGGPAKTVGVHADALKVDPKFETFDAFIRGKRFETNSLPGTQKYVSAKITQNGMIKLPPPISIKQQPYRHVDTLSVINVPEVENFMGYWQGTLLQEAQQRMGWMYGYYLEDKNYDEGCRALLEGIYEPPQNMNGEFAQPENDPNQANIDRVMEALGLERIGWIWTSLPWKTD